MCSSDLNEDSNQDIQVNQISITDSESQYADLIYYLKNGYAPSDLRYKRKHALRLKAIKYEIIDNVLFRKIMIQFC